MKQVVLVRHAKAVPWGYENDFDRDLTDRGRSDAGRVSRYLKSQGIVPGLIITSPARRALGTSLIFASEFDFPENRIRKDPELYSGYSPAEFLNFIRSLPEGQDVVFIFGHNPAIEYFARYLCSEYNLEVPTCSAIRITFEVNGWDEVNLKSGILTEQVNPKTL